MTWIEPNQLINYKPFGLFLECGLHTIRFSCSVPVSFTAPLPFSVLSVHCHFIHTYTFSLLPYSANLLSTSQHYFGNQNRLFLHCFSQATLFSCHEPFLRKKYQICKLPSLIFFGRHDLILQVGKKGCVFIVC